MNDVFGVILRSFEYGSIYALAALGVILVYRTSFMVNFAQGVIGMFNTYVVATLLTKANLNLPISILIGIGTSILMGILIDIVVIRHAKHVTGAGKEIITLGLMAIILGITPMIFGVYDIPLPKLIQKGAVNILGNQISYNSIFNIVFGIVIMVTLFNILHKTKAGLAIRTTASNETTARLMGVHTKKVTMLAWAVGGALSCLAGVMAAPFSTVSLHFMNDILIFAFLACILGGFQTFYGPVVAAYIIAVITNLFQVYFPEGTIWGKPIVYILILIFLIIKPTGLFGRKMVKKV
ncbi:MAG: branched-chain amino acid ABC transporter permease [Tissierellia bacterium]|nr:branched-chain amino acid ABC transporter permease [Tissierellia bacterium]